jgi:hypothetical protein
MRTVIVNIDRLVLSGFQARDRHAIGAGLEQELARMFADPTAMPLSGATPRLDLGSVAIAHDFNPRQVGTAVAQRIAGEIGK